MIAAEDAPPAAALGAPRKGARVTFDVTDLRSTFFSGYLSCTSRTTRKKRHF